MLHLKLELIVSSCEKSTNGVLGKVAECANSLRRKVSWICFYFVKLYVKVITTSLTIYFDTVID